MQGARDPLFLACWSSAKFSQDSTTPGQAIKVVVSTKLHKTLPIRLAQNNRTYQVCWFHAVEREITRGGWDWRNRLLSSTSNRSNVLWPITIRRCRPQHNYCPSRTLISNSIRRHFPKTIFNHHKRYKAKFPVGIVDDGVLMS